MASIHNSVRFKSSNDRSRLLKRLSGGRSSAVVDSQWKSLLKRNPSEKSVQAFLERHPSHLPGLSDLHNGPLHNVVVTKLPLAPDYETDFAFITRHSMALQFTFIEIERPNKRIFNKDGAFTQTFQHAHQQVRDWVLWSNNNLGILVQMFGPMFEGYNVTNDLKTVRGYLVYGHRAQFEKDRKKHNRWRTLHEQADDVIVMTYDRLGLRRDFRDEELIVCSYKDQGFFVERSLL